MISFFLLNRDDIESFRMSDHQYGNGIYFSWANRYTGRFRMFVNTRTCKSI